jgi:hypothetical protein
MLDAIASSQGVADAILRIPRSSHSMTLDEWEIQSPSERVGGAGLVDAGATEAVRPRRSDAFGPGPKARIRVWSPRGLSLPPSPPGNRPSGPRYLPLLASTKAGIIRHIAPRC